MIHKYFFIIRTVCISLMVLPVFFLPVYASPPAPAFPFHPGEKLTFSLRWGIIYAGKATLEVLPPEIFEGKPVYHFVMTAETNSFIDNFYKVRDRIDAYADISMNHSCLYQKKQREGKSKRDIIVTFDWKKQEAQFTNRGEAKPPVALMPGTFDPLSAFYYSRLTDFSTTQMINRPISDGKKNVMGIIRIIKKDTIKIGEKSYETFLLEPDLKEVNGVFEKSKDAKIQVWITADEWRIPVKIASKVIVGSFVGELISAVPGNPAEKQITQPQQAVGKEVGDEAGNSQDSVEQH